MPKALRSAQGYWFARPQPADDIAFLLRQGRLPVATPQAVPVASPDTHPVPP